MYNLVQYEGAKVADELQEVVIFVWLSFSFLSRIATTIKQVGV